MHPVKTVSILEDERTFQELLVDLVERAGMSVTHRSGDAREFMMSVTAAPPEVAIVDLRLEDAQGRSAGSGLEVVAELRARLPSVRTVVLTATHDRSIVNRCFELGANALVFKHLAGPNQVLAAVEAAGRGERLFPVSTLPVSTAELTGRPVSAAELTGPSEDLLKQLTPKEHSVLRFVSAGVDNAVISAHLSITQRTVKAHLASLYRKLQCDNRTQLALRARELGVAPQRE